MAENVGAVSFGVNLDNSGISSQVNSLGSSIGATFHNIVSGAFSVVLGQGLFSLVTSGFKSSVAAAWDFNSTMQSATTNFTTLLHSAGEASTLVSQLNAIDQASTLDMTDLSKAAQEMISFGVNSSQVIPTIKELGDISQGNSEKFNALSLAFSQTSSAGKLTGQDLLQYISAGFNPLQVIAQKTGKSMADLRDEMGKGQISAADVADAFKTATSAGGAFYNATANASKTYSGQMAMLGSSVTETLGAMIKPAFTDFTNNVLPHLTSVMGTVSDTFNATGSVTGAVAAGLKAAFGPQVSGAFTTIATGVQGSIGWIAEHGTAVIAVVAGIAGAMGVYKTVQLATNIAVGAGNILTSIGAIIKGRAAIAEKLSSDAIKESTAAQWLLNAAMSANPIGIIIIAIGALVAVLAVLFVKNQAFHNFVVTAVANIKAVVIGAITQIQTIATPIIQTLQQILTAAWSVISTTIISGLQTVQTWWNSVWPQIQNIFSVVWDAIKLLLMAVFAFIYPFIMEMLGLIQGLWTGVWGFIKDTFVGVWNIMVDALRAVWGIISDVVKAGLDLISGLINVFRDILTGNWSGAWNALVGTVRNVGGDLYGAVRSLFDGVWNILGDIANIAENWGRDIVNGLVNGIRGAFSNVKNAVGDVANIIKSFLHFSEPDTGPLVGFHTWMPDFMGGLAADIQDNRNKVIGAMQGLTSGMSMTINPTASLALAGSGNKFAAKSQTSSGMGSPTYRQNINFNGNYTFRDQTDIDHFMNQAALLINRKR